MSRVAAAAVPLHQLHGDEPQRKSQKSDMHQPGAHQRSPLHSPLTASRSIVVEAGSYSDSDDDDDSVSHPLTSSRKNSIYQSEDDRQFAALKAKRKRYKLMAIGFIFLLVAGILTNILLSAQSSTSSSSSSNEELESNGEEETEDTHSYVVPPPRQQNVNQVARRSPPAKVEDPTPKEHDEVPVVERASTPPPPIPCVAPAPPPPPPTTSMTFVLQPSLSAQLAYDRDSPHFNLWDRALSLPEDIAATLDDPVTRASSKQWWMAHAAASKLILDEADEWQDKQVLDVPLLEPKWLEIRKQNNASFKFIFPEEITLREEEIVRPDSCSPYAKRVKPRAILKLLPSTMQVLHNEECLERHTGHNAQFGEVAEGFQLKPPTPVANLAAPHPCGSARRVLKGIQHGKWVGRYEWFHGGPFYQTLVQSKFDEFDHKFAYYSACPLLHYTPEQVCEILSRFTRVMLIGEENMTHLFLALLMLTNGNWETGHLNAQVKDATEQQRMYVKEHCSGNRAFLPDCAPYWSTHLKDLLYDSCPMYKGGIPPEPNGFVPRYAPLQKLSLKSWRKVDSTLENQWTEVGNTPATRLSDTNMRRFLANPIHVGGLAVVDTGSTELLHGEIGRNMKENAEAERAHLHSLDSFYQKLTASFRPDESEHTAFHPLWMPMDRVQDDIHQRFGVSEDSASYLGDHTNWKVNERVAHILRGVNSKLRNTSSELEFLSRVNGVVNRREKMVSFDLSPEEITAPFRLKKEAGSKDGVATFASAAEFELHEHESKTDSFTSPDVKVRMCPSPITSPFTPPMRDWTALNFRALTECVPPSWSIDGIHYIPTVHIMKGIALLNYMHALILEYDDAQYQRS